MPSPRPPLSRDRVLRAAVRLADRDGLAALTARSLAAALQVQPMSLYHHVRNKDEILDGITDLVFGEIVLPVPGRDWVGEVRRRAISARDVLVRHPWALGLLETRTSPGPATLRHHEAMLATLREGGLGLAQTARVYAVIDSYVYGFVIQQISLPFDATGGAAGMAESIVANAPGDYPRLREFATGHVMAPGYDFGDEFEPGLDLVLAALAATDPGPAVPPA